MRLSPQNEDRLWRDSEEPKGFPFSIPFRYIIVALLLILLLMGLWYLMTPGRQWQDKTDLSLIKADGTPYKIKAENQGVPGVKHQDKLVYGRIRADENGTIAEHILPDPEEPLPHIKEDTTAIKMVDQYIPEDGDPDAVVEEAKPEKIENESLTRIEDLIVEEADAPKETSPQNQKGTVRIQLGSLKSYDLAESEWKRLLAKHPEVLGGLEPIIQKIDLGEEQGIYYRLRTGSFEGVEKANDACAQLKAQKVECVVIP